MKLRNKHTGEIVECENIVFTHCNALALDWEQYNPNVNSLAELNADWEDVEPLIKDEKIRKAVKAWAEACGAKQIKYSIAPNQYYDADMGTGFSIKFMTKPIEVYLEEDKNYTITELCGEEEE